MLPIMARCLHDVLYRKKSPFDLDVIIYICIKVRKMKDVNVFVLTPSLLTQTKTDLRSDAPFHEKTLLKKVFR